MNFFCLTGSLKAQITWAITVREGDNTSCIIDKQITLVPHLCACSFGLDQGLFSSSQISKMLTREESGLKIKQVVQLYQNYA